MTEFGFDGAAGAAIGAATAPAPEDTWEKPLEGTPESTFPPEKAFPDDTPETPDPKNPPPGKTERV